MPRHDFIHETLASTDAPVVEIPLSLWERLAASPVARKVFILVVLAVVWEVYARWLDNPLLFPTLGATLTAFVNGLVTGELVERSWVSLSVLLIGYGAGVVLAFTFAVIAITSRLGNDFLETLTAMFNPLPAIALLPLALLWFGLGIGSLIFVLIHSVLWAVALNAHAGFKAVPETTRMVGRNYGLVRHRAGVEDPAAGRVSEHPRRPQDRMGVRLAHADRGGAGVRHHLRLRRARLVHLREQEPDRDTERVRGIAHRDPDRAHRREPDLPRRRSEDGAALGHAALSCAVPARNAPDATMRSKPAMRPTAGRGCGRSDCRDAAR